MVIVDSQQYETMKLIFAASFLSTLLHAGQTKSCGSVLDGLSVTSMYSVLCRGLKCH